MLVETPRLLLRHWRESDGEAFYQLNSDPRVMEFFPKCLTREESDALIARAEAHFETNGFGPFAAEFRQAGELAGFIGLSVPRFEAYFTPCVEIGWRLAHRFWNQGLATEGATAVLQFAFGPLKLPEIVSFTVPANLRSRRVMEKIGLLYDGEFDNPELPEGHELRRHVLYRRAAKPR
ncbi:MAG: GNAT family N-acetyltransferase [Acidobacteriia bacterium]|nr:GNAT family N-acetyltransferase [Terriglobia bacterium]